MSIENITAYIVVLLAALSCVKWIHAYAHERRPSHLSTIFIRVFFVVAYTWILVNNVPADNARTIVRILISLLFFDEIVNWLGTFIFNQISRRKQR